MDNEGTFSDETLATQAAYVHTYSAANLDTLSVSELVKLLDACEAYGDTFGVARVEAALDRRP